jgi:S-formylglutathione hydrolase FrmB
MKKLTLSCILFLFVAVSLGQNMTGKVVVARVNSPALKNIGGENPVRSARIYLPPDYDATSNRYPVIYYLHGFGWSDSLQIAGDHFDQLLDKAINTGKIRPVIVVMPNNKALTGGSFYTNSTLTGNWSDFNAKDLVGYVDQNFRTIANRDSRGVGGHSMGGYGAIKLGALFPDVFSTVYGLSPGGGGLYKEFGPNSFVWKRAQEIKTVEQLMAGEFFAAVVISMGRVFTPNPNKPPFYADLPFYYENDKLVVDDVVLDTWTKHSLVTLADTYTENFRKLKALKLDWGRNEDFAHIPMVCMMFSQKLENKGIEHYAEEYIGDHGNKLWTDDGRAMNDMLPFFNSWLTFEKTVYVPIGKKKK